MEILGFEIQYDKWLHFLVVAMPALWALFIAKEKLQIWFAFIFCALVAAGKELIYDLVLENGNPEVLDFMYSMIAPTLILIVSLKIRKNV